jgi:hypothetical protein
MRPNVARCRSADRIPATMMEPTPEHRTESGEGGQFTGQRERDQPAMRRDG